MEQKEPIFEYLESIAELIPAGFYWCDLKLNFIGINTYGLNSINVKNKDAIVGKNALEIYKNHNSINQMQKVVDKMVETGKIVHSEDMVINVATGRPEYFSATRAPIRNSSGEIIAFLGVSINITAEKEAAMAQEEVKKLKYERDIEAVRSEAHKNKIMQEFGVIAAKVAHDISSPLMVANSSINKIKSDKNSLGQQLLLIEQSLNDIKNISSKILTTYREITGNDSKVKLHKVDDGNIKRYVLLSSLLENQIGFKKIEWQNNPCKLELKINDDARNIFAYISPTDFNRSISNLLNNAYESLDATDRNIFVELDLEINREKFILKITDTGSGIPEDKIANVLSGESTKHVGHGMGLSGAKKYFETIDGTLNITSKVNQGTEILIEFPLAKDPEWFERSISCNSETKIIVLDDSSTIIMLWQRVLSDLDVKSQYFMNIDDFMQWYDEQSDKMNILLFVDYDLGNENFTGLDVVNKIKDINSYLVTNHSEEAWLQEIIKSNQLKMLPKKIIEHLKFTNSAKSCI